MRQQGRLDDGRQTDMGFRHPEDRVVRGDRQVAGDEEFQARAQGRPADPGNHRRRVLADGQEGPVQAADELLRGDRVEVLHLPDVGAAAEHAVAGDDQHPWVRRGGLAHRAAQLRGGCRIEGVCLRAPDQNDPRHVAIEVEPDVRHPSGIVPGSAG